MATTEISSVFGSKSTEKPKAVVTCDLLGGSSSTIETQQLYPNMRVPSGWEKCLDLKTGKVYIQRMNNSLCSPSEHKFQVNKVDPKVEDLNSSASRSKVSLMNPINEANLDLKLVSCTLPSSNYQSVFSLDKVRLSLERGEKEQKTRKRDPPLKLSPSVYYTSSSSSTKEAENEEKFSSPIAAGCSSCLSYVVVLKHNPKCPRCNSDVSFPLTKKPKIDLNISI